MHLCPVCGYPNLTDAPWMDGSPSDEICVCCGTHFGYDDDAGGDAGQRERIWITLRRTWTENGCSWFSKRTAPPFAWNPESQLSVFD